MDKWLLILKEFIGYSIKKLLKIWIIFATIITIITVSIGWNCYQFWKDPPYKFRRQVGKDKAFIQTKEDQGLFTLAMYHLNL